MSTLTWRIPGADPKPGGFDEEFLENAQAEVGAEAAAEEESAEAAEEAPVEEAAVEAAEEPPAEPESGAEVDPYSRSFIPFFKEEKTPRDELVKLLKLAAEIEHALLIQYLYAANSIVDGPDPKDSPTSADKIKSAILKISKQEMGHYLAVQNLLISIGGVESVHLDKDKYRATDSNFNPMPFTLEPLSKILLAKFTAIEAPLEIPESLQEEVEEIRKIAVAETGTVLNPVGGLYMRIFWLFQADDNAHHLMPLTPNEDVGRKPGWHIKDTDFLPVDEIKKYEALENSWVGQSSFAANKLTLKEVHTREEALELVHAIAVQGEGPETDEDVKSHFMRFLDAFERFDDAHLNIRKIPVNPITVENPEYKVATPIENEYSLLWAALLNLVYTSLLLDIYSSFYYRQFAPVSKTGFIGLIFTGMKANLKSLQEIILRLPLASGPFLYNADPRCGSPFEIDKAFAPVPSKDKMDAQNSDILNRVIDVITKIREHADFENHLDAEDSQETDSSVNAEGALERIGVYCDRKRELISK
jgi:rubrerythrin